MKTVQKMANWLSNRIGVREDYILHFGVCFLFSLLGTYGAVLSLGLSLGKEMGDKANPNSGWSWWDLLADGLGIVTGLIVYFLVFCCLFQ